MSRVLRDTASSGRSDSSPFGPMSRTPSASSGPPTAGRHFAAILRRRWYVVVVCVIVAGAVAYAVSNAQTPQYSAQATLLVVPDLQILRDANSPQTGGGADTSGSSFDASTGLALGRLDVLSRSVSRALDDSVSPSDIRAKVSIGAPTGAGIVTVTATDADPQKAARIATTFAETYIAFLKDADQTSYRQAITRVRDRLRSLVAADASADDQESIRDQLRELKNSAALQTGGLRLIQRAGVPGSSFSPEVAKTTAIGLIGGLLLGVALALAIDALDRRVRDFGEFERIYDRPLLGDVPRSRSIAEQHRSPRGLDRSGAEAFRILRANLRYAQGAKGAKRVIVSSSTSGEGKSTVAWNLALIAAQGGTRVLLIEADLRQPGITRRYLPGAGSSGLSQVLSGQASADETLIDYASWAKDNNLREEFGQFCVMPAGGTPPNPAELLASQEMVELLDELEERFDLVILDAPAPTLVADPIPLYDIVDGVIVVGRLNYSDRRQLAKHRQRLESVGARVLGLVVNGTTPMANNSYH